jgi:hypothetical protein
MAIDYSYIRHGSNKGPNAAWIAQMDQQANPLNARQQAEAYRMASQQNRNFMQGSPQEPLQDSQATTPQAPMQTQPTSPFSGFAEGYGGGGFDGSFGPSGSGGNFKSLMGADRDLAGLTSFGLGQIGAPIPGILGQALFGDEAGMKNAFIGTGVGLLANEVGGKFGGALVGPVSKALQGKSLTSMDLINSVLSMNPTTRAAMGIFNVGKSLANMFEKSQRNKRETENMDQQDFDMMSGVPAPAPSTLNDLFMEQPNTMTTENTYDAPGSAEFTADSFDPLNMGTQGGGDLAGLDGWGGGSDASGAGLGWT